MSEGRKQWLDRIVDACVSIFLASLALNFAVGLLVQVWAELMIITALLGVLVVTLVIWRARRWR